MWREILPVARSLDDDLVAGIGEAVQGAVAQDGIIEEAEPVWRELEAAESSVTSFGEATGGQNG